jgi:hypothetical protein
MLKRWTTSVQVWFHTMEPIIYILPIATDFSPSSRAWTLLYAHKFPPLSRKADVETSHWQYLRCLTSIHILRCSEPQKKQDEIGSLYHVSCVTKWCSDFTVFAYKRRMKRHLLIFKVYSYLWIHKHTKQFSVSGMLQHVAMTWKNAATPPRISRFLIFRVITCTWGLQYLRLTCHQNSFSFKVKTRIDYFDILRFIVPTIKVYL